MKFSVFLESAAEQVTWKNYSGFIAALDEDPYEETNWLMLCDFIDQHPDQILNKVSKSARVSIVPRSSTHNRQAETLLREAKQLFELIPGFVCYQAHYKTWFLSYMNRLKHSNNRGYNNIWFGVKNTSSSEHNSGANMKVVPTSSFMENTLPEEQCFYVQFMLIGLLEREVFARERAISNLIYDPNDVEHLSIDGAEAHELARVCRYEIYKLDADFLSEMGIILRLHDQPHDPVQLTEKAWKIIRADFYKLVEKAHKSLTARQYRIVISRQANCLLEKLRNWLINNQQLAPVFQNLMELINGFRRNYS